MWESPGKGHAGERAGPGTHALIEILGWNQDCQFKPKEWGFSRSPKGLA